MKEKLISIIKNRKIVTTVCIAIVVVLLISIFPNKNIIGRWEIANLKEWEKYSASIYRVDLPKALELFSDGTGIINYTSYSQDDITWHADDGRLRIDGKVFNYKISFGKLILNYQDDERNDTITYKKK
ncbi:MAG: hypothetical protein IJ944_06565 [Clostridia bacterium]|nr:hypothetical protein [Clostridia bacterium]